VRFLCFLAIIFAVSCNKTPETKPIVIVDDKPIVVTRDNVDFSGELGQKITLWATWYNAPDLKHNPNGIPLRDKKSNPLGAKLSQKDWCTCAIEGTCFINGQTYNYAGTTKSHRVMCNLRGLGAVDYTKFMKSPFKYGKGNKMNPLAPFKSIACDQGNIRASKRWLNGGYMKFGQRIYIPAAKGKMMPNGIVHDGFFQCDDVGGAIYGNHIDIFIGRETKSPFDFIKSNKNGTFTAYLVK